VLVHLVHLVQVPTGAAEYAGEARGLLSQLLSGGLTLSATVLGRDRPGPKDNAKHPKWANGLARVTLTDPATQVCTCVGCILGFRRTVTQTSVF
jgi:hypothetical protein